jgi:hypothetical protein
VNLIIELRYAVLNEKAALDIQREILDYVNKGLKSISARLYVFEEPEA